MKKIQSIRGMNDILPDQTPCWSALEKLLQKISEQYGYKELRIPCLESTDLFSRAIGETTDIVEKEMYTFADRNGDSLTLRPEGTAGCIRAGIEHGLFYNQIQRLYYYGPMFRHERPQKGRYRQFHQFGAEAYGLPGPDIDAEIIMLTLSFWQELKIADKVELQINSLGTAESRAKYREELVKYFTANFESLDEDSKRRLESNPLRILDSKNPELKKLISNAPKILDHLDEDSKTHFVGLCKLLDEMKVSYVVNPCLVRGLDYYCHTVFEWVSTDLGAQNAVCAGGHYDGLVERLGGKSTPAIGFSIGLERLLLLASNNLVLPDLDIVYLAVLGDKAMVRGMLLAKQIRQNTGLKVVVNCNDGNLSTQLKRADKSGAKLALILGEDELAKEEVLVKYLWEDKPQESIKTENLLDLFKRGQAGCSA
jgi:histidyl-tRNA synthetase